MPNSVLRVVTALVGIPAVVGLLYLGAWPFALLVLTISLLAQYEVYHLLELGGLRPYRAFGMALGALLVLQTMHRPLLYAAAAVVVVAVAWWPLERRSLDGGTPEASPTGIGALGATLFGAVYPSALLAFLVEIRLARGPQVDDLRAFFLALTVFLLVWSTDTLAYYVGRAFGKRPLAPLISPAKTWAGAIGGVAGSLGAAVLLKVVALDVIPWMHVAALGLLAGVVGQLGDLAESKLKRQVGAKDSGTLLPGHGGLLDRFDAMIVVAPVAYLYLRFAAGLFG